jgi:hypothetical protein
MINNEFIIQYTHLFHCKKLMQMLMQFTKPVDFRQTARAVMSTPKINDRKGLH